jgi:hypothetical protein
LLEKERTLLYNSKCERGSDDYDRADDGDADDEDEVL